MPFFGFSRAKKKQSKTTREEVPRERVPGKIRYEIVREKDERSIVVKRGRIRPKQEWIRWRGRAYFPNHIIKETTGTKVRYFARFNMYYCEALDLIHPHVPDFDPALENNIMNDMMMQLGDAVGAAVGFTLERPMIILLFMGMVFGIPIGLSFNDIFHWVPNTVVHWVTRA